MSYIVDEKWLKDKLENHYENTIVIDASAMLGKPDAGKQMYEEKHIPYAVHLDLVKDLAGAPEKHGGRNPLPEPEVFAEKLGEIGVDLQKTVVIYDQAEGMYAARAWWLIHYLGHESVYLLNGGLKAWEDAGNEVTKKVVEHESTVFTPNMLENAVVHIDGVKEKMKEKTATLIDSRARARYLGQGEELDPKAGHIPGAKNFFWKNVLTEEGDWKDLDQLQQNFSTLKKDEEIIVSCGSGISACPNIIALKSLGYENVKLYPGSFSDWISYEENQVETKEE